MLVLLIAGCSNPENDFEKAQQVNTIASYQEFLTKHPDSTFLTKKAKRIIDSLAFNEALSINTPEGFKDYIEMYSPDSSFIEKATERLCDLNYQDAKKENTIRAYTDFINQYPNCPKTDSARIKINDLRPRPGTWKGNDIEFNIPPDRIKISSNNSRLENACSVILTANTTSFTSMNFLYEDIMIEDDGSFSIKHDDQSYTQSGNITFQGKFTSPTTASGKFIFNDYGSNQLNGTIEWKAKHIR